MNTQVEKMDATRQSEANAEKYIVALYSAAALCGLVSGVVQVAVQDPLFTALLVTAATMAFGLARPARPWRWTLLVGLPIPLVLIAAKLLGYYANFTRATLAGSLLIMLPGIAGAFGGSFMRTVIGNIFFEKE